MSYADMFRGQRTGDEFPLRDVILIEGPFKHARDLNIKTLLMYDMERLPAPYRKEAGLPSGSTEPVYHIRITE